VSPGQAVGLGLGLGGVLLAMVAYVALKRRRLWSHGVGHGHVEAHQGPGASGASGRGPNLGRDAAAVATSRSVDPTWLGAALDSELQDQETSACTGEEVVMTTVVARDRHGGGAGGRRQRRHASSSGAGSGVGSAFLDSGVVVGAAPDAASAAATDPQSVPSALAALCRWPVLGSTCSL
jgi:hypothetical protein